MIFNYPDNLSIGIMTEDRTDLFNIATAPKSIVHGVRILCFSLGNKPGLKAKLVAVVDDTDISETNEINLEDLPNETGNSLSWITFLFSKKIMIGTDVPVRFDLIINGYVFSESSYFAICHDYPTQLGYYSGPATIGQVPYVCEFIGEVLD